MPAQVSSSFMNHTTNSKSSQPPGATVASFRICSTADLQWDGQFSSNTLGMWRKGLINHSGSTRSDNAQQINTVPVSTCTAHTPSITYGLTKYTSMMVLFSACVQLLAHIMKQANLPHCRVSTPAVHRATGIDLQYPKCLYTASLSQQKEKWVHRAHKQSGWRLE